MTTYSAPDPVQSTFFIPGGNTPGNGVQVFFYVAASVSTKLTVYKDVFGLTNWSNPIVLDSGGNLPSGGIVWFAGGQRVKVVWAPATDTDPPSSPYRTIDQLAGIDDPSVSGSPNEWITGITPTFVSATSFSLAGDQTSVLTPGRRLKTVNTSGIVYSTIFTSVFGGATTVITVVNDSTPLDSGLNTLFYGFLAADHVAVPLLPGERAVIQDPTDTTKRAFVTISSAASSTNTQILTSLNVSSIIASSVAGSIQASTGASLVLLASKNITSQPSTIAFSSTDVNYALYDQYKFVITGTIPITTATALMARVSTDNGATSISTGAYNWGVYGFNVVSGAIISTVAADDHMQLTIGAQNTTAAGLGLNGEMILYQPQINSSGTKYVGVNTVYNATLNRVNALNGGGQITAGNINTVQFAYNIGQTGYNFQSTGAIRCYGVKIS